MSNKEYYQKNKEYAKEYFQENKEDITLYLKKYRLENKEKDKTQNHHQLKVNS